MSLNPLPLSDVALSIQSIETGEQLTLNGIDLDSGRTVSLSITTSDADELSQRLFLQQTGLVLVLSLYTVSPTVV